MMPKMMPRMIPLYKSIAQPIIHSMHTCIDTVVSITQREIHSHAHPCHLMYLHRCDYMDVIRAHINVHAHTNVHTYR